MNEKYVCLILPVYGNPYIANDKTTSYNVVKQILRGYIKKINGENLYVRPNIFKPYKEWNSVNGLLMFGKNKNEYEFYVTASGFACLNENVSYCSVDTFENENLLNKKNIRGDVVILLNEKYVEEFNITYKPYQIINCEHCDCSSFHMKSYSQLEFKKR